MLTIRKRGKTFHADLMRGDGHVARGSLGTRNRGAAQSLAGRLEAALFEGPTSVHWQELERLLPTDTFVRFASAAGVQQQKPPTWNDLRAAFRVFAEQRIKVGKLAKSTVQRYEHTFSEFDLFLAVQRIQLLRDISVALIEEFKVHRTTSIRRRRQSRGGTSVSLDAAILHRIFSFAVKREMATKNPVQLEGRPGENPQRGAEPFTPEELAQLREHAGPDLLCLLVLRWTGFRGSDAVILQFREINFRTREVDHITQKRNKRVILPLHQELLFALEAEREKRAPESAERVLLNPSTEKPLSRARLYERMIALGRRAGVPHAHPHRFRDTFAVDLLLRGASAYDVAKMLGDTIETVEKHYTPFVRELRERVRNILQSGNGMEELFAKSSENPTAEPVPSTKPV